jgi:hypothetical protein
MFVLGIILILLAVGAFLAAVVGASNDMSTFELGAFNVEMNTLGVFFAGAATVLLLMLGLALVKAGVAGANRRRREKKELRRKARELDARENAATTPTHGTTHEAGPGTTTATRTDTRPTDPGVTGTDHSAH